MTSNTPIVQDAQAPSIITGALTVKEVGQQILMVQELMKDHMQEGEHYGKIPGCGDKDTLLKPGSEKLCFMFRLSPTLDIDRTDYKDGHREYTITCTLTHIPSGAVMGQGVGSCSTLEAKYRYRNATLKCPECGMELRKSKNKPEWYCWAKQGGCGATFALDAEEITSQPRGKIEHDNPADYYNTVLKMAKKRAQVDATLSVTAASDIFTQDIEDMQEVLDVTPQKKSEAVVTNGADPMVASQGTSFKDKVITNLSLPEIKAYLKKYGPKGANTIPPEELQVAKVHYNDRAKEWAESEAINQL